MVIKRSYYKDGIQAVIFDWAGTTVDYGCFAPAIVFVEVFKKRGINIQIDEARAPMGLMKLDHIKAICKMDRIKELWIQEFGRVPDEKDINDLYIDFEPMLFEILPNHCEPIPGVLELIDSLKKKGIKIGSTTGYTNKMIEIVSTEAKKRGYEINSIVSSSDVPEGRPYPWMCFQNAINLKVFPPEAIMKVGDTVSDIKEGLNAGMWSVGVIKGGNDLGLTENEVKNLPGEVLERKVKEVRERFKNAGAHYIVDSISELEKVIEEINEKMTSEILL